MIPKECLFSDRQKLKLILNGTDNVCLGVYEKDDNGVYKKCEFCHRCNFHDKNSCLFTLPKNNQSIFNPLSVSGYVIGAAPNTGGINVTPNTYNPLYNNSTYNSAYNNSTYNPILYNDIYNKKLMDDKKFDILIAGSTTGA
jgi:hypothetical protein